MISFGRDIVATIEVYAPRLAAIDASDAVRRPAPDKWSKKEILGHLTDSAQVNLQRMIRGQVEESPRIIYDQDEWVRVQRYQDYAMPELIDLWVAFNRHLSHTIQVMDEGNRHRTCDTGKTGVELRTLEYLAGDYLVHMKHHLNQIFPGA